MDAPAKLNLVLQVGSRRADGLHDVCSLFASLELCDLIHVEAAAGTEDVVHCPRVDGDNLAAAALRAYRASTAGATLPPLFVKIDKRIPVAAGLGGGSADAAAVLRAANAFTGNALKVSELRAIASSLGSDVPSQIDPRHALVTGSGERIEPVSLPTMEVVLVPAPAGLSTADVYREADRIGSTRRTLDPEAVRALANEPLAILAAGLENDLEPAARSLRPDIEAAIGSLIAAGALGARVTGSGPTVFGVFDDRSEAAQAAARIPGAIVTALRSVADGCGSPR